MPDFVGNGHWSRFCPSCFHFLVFDVGLLLDAKFKMTSDWELGAISVDGESVCAVCLCCVLLCCLRYFTVDI